MFANKCAQPEGHFPRLGWPPEQSPGPKSKQQRILSSEKNLHFQKVSGFVSLSLSLSERPQFPGKVQNAMSCRLFSQMGKVRVCW